MFALPADVVDKHLRVASKSHLKTILWMFRHAAEPFDIDKISADTGVSKEDIPDCMQYWINAGIIEEVNENKTEEIKTENKPEEINYSKSEDTVKFNLKEKTGEKNLSDETVDKSETSVKAPVSVKPTISEVALMAENNEEVRYLFEQAQITLGRMLGYDAQANLLMLMTYYNLPKEVILTLCSYSATIGKQGSMDFIVRTGRKWAEKGINTFELASQEIEKMESADRVWSEFRRATGIETPRPTSAQSRYISVWMNDYGFNIDMILLAYEKTAEAKGKIDFKYMNGILKSWFSSGFKSTEDVEKSENDYREKNESAKTAKKKKTGGSLSSEKNGRKPTYDIDFIKHISEDIDPNDTKRS